jgi:hypothetical protein
MSDVDTTNEEHEELVDPKQVHYRIPDNLIGFKTIVDYLPISIGLYHQFLPSDYFPDVFKQCKNYFTSKPEASANLASDYQMLLGNLRLLIDETVTRYKGQVKEIDMLNDQDSFFKEERHYIIDNLKKLGDADPEDEDVQTFVVKYLTTYPHPNLTEKKALIEHIDSDVFVLLSRLYEISEYAALFDPSECNSFKRFCENIIIHMRANRAEKYPKSIVNYSCFMYSIKNYPYCTPTKRIYSINNYSNTSGNKFHNVIIYMKNTDALISYLYDIRFKNNEGAFIKEEWILRLAYCLCIALLAYRSEYVEYQAVSQNLFGTK